MKLDDVMICWTPIFVKECETAGMVKLFSYPDYNMLSRDFISSGGGCYKSVKKMTTEQKTRHLFIEFAILVVRDGLNPLLVHNTFCEIYEYRLGLSCDTPVPKHIEKKFKRELYSE